MNEHTLPPNVVFSESLQAEKLTPEQLEKEIQEGTIIGNEVPFPRLLVMIGFAPSTSEARRLIKGGGVYIGQEKVRVAENQSAIFVRRA